MTHNPNQQMAAIFHDLQIDASNWQENPKEFLGIMKAAAQKLSAQLDNSNSLQTMEDKFRQKALKDPAANTLADEVIKQFEDVLSELTPEVLCCILTRLPEVTRSVKSSITGMAMRQEKTFSKKRVHGMYNRLRKAIDEYITFMFMFFPEKIGTKSPTGKFVKPAGIPSRPGNYGSSSSSVVEYEFVVDGESYLNYYTAARIVEVPINHYMDLVDAFKAAENGKINGHDIILKIIGEEED